MVIKRRSPNYPGIDLEEAEYYGSGIIAAPFSFQTDVFGSYYIFKSDFGALTEGRAASIGISEYGNKHYYEAEEEFSVTVNGRITLTMDLSSLPNGEVSLDHLECTRKLL